MGLPKAFVFLRVVVQIRRILHRKTGIVKLDRPRDIAPATLSCEVFPMLKDIVAVSRLP